MYNLINHNHIHIIQSGDKICIFHFNKGMVSTTYQQKKKGMVSINHVTISTTYQEKKKGMVSINHVTN